MSADADPRGWHGRGYLPHFDSPERIQHVVMRTSGSLPRHLACDLAPADVGRILDEQAHDALFTNYSVAEIVEAALLHFDGSRYELLAWCVMPNHVHVVLQQVAGFRLGDVVASWKGHTARRINGALGRSGAVWAPDYFDRFVRHEAQLVELLNYVENNPVFAGLVQDACDWRFSSARLRRV